MNINPFKTFRVLVTRYYESIRKPEAGNRKLETGNRRLEVKFYVLFQNFKMTVVP